jgi:hypothetical protein
MKRAARWLSPLFFSFCSLLLALALGCADTQTVADPTGTLSADRSTAPGLAQACAEQPGRHLARRPNAPLALECAFALPQGSAPIQNGTKSWVDGGRYYLTELANASLYVFDVVTHGYVGSVTGFVGSTGSNATSGPNSVVFTGDGRAWVSDGISAVRVVDLASRSIIATVSTTVAACDDGTVHNCQRTNEITFDPEHRIVFVENPSPLDLSGSRIDTYGTFISADPPYPVLGTVVFAGRSNAEAPLWDPEHHRILVALTGTAALPPGIAVIDPTVRPFAVEQTYDIDCAALGLSGTAINDPALAPGGHMIVPACGRAVIMDTRTGAVTTVLPVGGGNETWYNPGDGNFYVTGADFRTTPAGPNSLGVIDARSGAVLQTVPALLATNPAAAADNNEVFTVVRANAGETACTAFGLESSGCVLVFAHVPGAAP